MRELAFIILTKWMVMISFIINIYEQWARLFTSIDVRIEAQMFSIALHKWRNIFLTRLRLVINAFVSSYVQHEKMLREKLNLRNGMSNNSRFTKDWKIKNVIIITHFDFLTPSPTKEFVRNVPSFFLNDTDYCSHWFVSKNNSSHMKIACDLFYFPLSYIFS